MIASWILIILGYTTLLVTSKSNCKQGERIVVSVHYLLLESSQPTEGDASRWFNRHRRQLL
jgi:hypothetical protein